MSSTSNIFEFLIYYMVLLIQFVLIFVLSTVPHALIFNHLLLQAVNTLSELPLDPISETLHNKIPNWEMVSEIVNATSIISRSARQVRHA